MDVFVARQPIFDRDQEVFAYELLFRSSLNNYFSHPDQNQAASKVIADTSFLFDIESITSGKKAFVNVTREVLLNDYVSVLPKKLTVVEVLENVEPGEDVVEACRRLKADGYMLALDDFVYDQKFLPLIKLADVIKVDFLGTTKEVRSALINQLRPYEVQFLAERVETREEFDWALSMGYTYFQGYFFSKPVIIQGKDVPGFKLNYLQILQEINRSDLKLNQIEAIIKRDVSLSYKLLRYVNAPFFGWRTAISSIRHALTLLGDSNVKKWVSLVALASMGEDKPEELVVLAIVRAKFCESIAQHIGLRHREQDLFLMGMFSLIDAMIDRPIGEVLEKIPIAEDVKAALLGGRSQFRDVYELVVAYEQGDWNACSGVIEELEIDEKILPELYLDALTWATQSPYE